MLVRTGLLNISFVSNFESASNGRIMNKKRLQKYGDQNLANFKSFFLTFFLNLKSFDHFTNVNLFSTIRSPFFFGLKDM